jgi:hypothetical protein
VSWIDELFFSKFDLDIRRSLKLVIAEDRVQFIYPTLAFRCHADLVLLRQREFD